MDDMKICRFAVVVLSALLFIVVTGSMKRETVAEEKHLLYVASPGIRNYVEYGGVGMLVYDITAGHKFVKRIPTWPAGEGSEGNQAENVKGVVANAKTAKIYVSTPKRVACFDLITEKKIWEKEYEGGCVRMALSPDGRTMYVPSFEGPHWLVVDALTGEVNKKLELNSAPHNTIYSPDATFAYLAALKSPLLRVADTKTHPITTEVGPSRHLTRAVTINRDQA